ncbi:hypothetical protein HMPREF9730_02622 [Treponema denticola AL-2]|nr:hypothetical protein HMPREF9730_02622 [Treponema denticola AL-2]
MKDVKDKFIVPANKGHDNCNSGINGCNNC